MPRVAHERNARDAHWERLLRRYRGGDRAARERLVGEMLPLVHQLARRFTGKAPHDDLVQAGLFGLTKALGRFDPAQGSALSSYAVPTMLGEMRRHLRDHTWSVRLPRGLQEDVLHVNHAVSDLEARLARSPTPQQVADAVGLELETVVEALVAGRAYRAASLDERVGGEADDLALIDTLGAEDPELRRRELLVTLGQARHVLSERERYVLHLRFAEDRTQTEIAMRIGVSQMQVSRILRALLAKLHLELRRQGAARAA
ncbi:MAG TPA: SigB/SigF/SigG family RNA polymerase sigma factor [Solirubrobacteraceae bacterium]